MLREAWRLQREQFWDPQMSGIDWDAVLERYDALLPRVRTRAELSDLIWEMQGELGTSHAYEMGGDLRVPPQYRRGFLGADYAWDDARTGYRIDAILRGDSWNRSDDSPLAEPGVDVRAGDAIVAVGGVRVTRSAHARRTARQPGRPRRRARRRTRRERRAACSCARCATSGCCATARGSMRTAALVHERTGNRVGYVHIPDMGPWGFAEFHRGYLTEFERDGLIVDVRYNRGGHVSPLLLEKLARKRVGYDVSRYGPPQPYPPESRRRTARRDHQPVCGFRRRHLLALFQALRLGHADRHAHVGRRDRHQPLSRTRRRHDTTQPEYSFWFLDAGWQVENYGTDPDVEIDIAPQDSAAGVDPQMEKALELIGAALAGGSPAPAFPPYPDRSYRPR